MDEIEKIFERLWAMIARKGHDGGMMLLKGKLPLSSLN